MFGANKFWMSTTNRFQTSNQTLELSGETPISFQNLTISTTPMKKTLLFWKYFGKLKQFFSSAASKGKTGSAFCQTSEEFWGFVSASASSHL